jgi:predicted permease
MRVLKTVRLRLRSVFRRNHVENELAAELREHLEREIERHRAAGLSHAEARAAALREFGNVALIQEQCRDVRGVLWLEDLLRDVVYALRMMRRAPGHTAVTALSLAAALGANTATFSVVNTLLLRRLPVANPGDLVELGSETPNGPGNFPYSLYERVRGENNTFTEVVAVSSPVVRADSEMPDQPPLGRYVSGNFFQALGIRPAIGRLLEPDDDRLDSPDGAMVAVISNGFWQRMFGQESTVLGKTLAVGGTPSRTAVPFTIVGVLPPEFQGLTVGRSDDFYIPLAREPRVSSRSLLNSPGAGWLKVVARLKPGISRPMAKAELDVIYARFVDEAARLSSEATARQMRTRRMAIEPARAGLSGPRREFGRPLLLLMGAVGLVLVVACANVVNLLLARGLARRGEIGVRLAIGASSGRLMRQLLAEAALFGVIGGSVGLALAVWGTPHLAVLMANEDPSVAYDVAPDRTVLLFTIVVSLAAALVAGLIPALRVSRAKVPSLREEAGTREAAGRLSPWTRSLVAFQVALSLLLLAGALLLLTTLRNFRTGDFGFDRQGVLSMRLDPSRAGYAGERRVAYFRAVLDRARNTPGVRGAALSLGMPVISAGVDMSFRVDGLPRDPDATVFVNDVTQGYFAATGTRLLRGRDFGPDDGPGSAAVAIVNDALVRRYFGGRDPIGQRVWAGNRGTLEVVGVVATTKYQSLRESDSPIIYVHALQSASGGGLNLIVKTAGDPMSMGAGLRRAIQDIAPVHVTPPETLSSQIDRTLIAERLIARVLGLFALLAIVLAAAGLYGVLAYNTARRTREIGIRLALGATPRAVLWPVLAESVKLAAMGIAMGVPAALALTRLLSSLLYGVAPTDPYVLGAVALCLFCVALMAAVVPAARASRVDPLAALRYE